MPDFKCPNCETPLRDEDTCVYEARTWTGTLIASLMTIQMSCWVCSWSSNWQAANVIQESDAVPTGAAGEGEKA